MGFIEINASNPMSLTLNECFEDRISDDLLRVQQRKKQDDIFARTVSAISSDDAHGPHVL